jgi:hypothetical protein
MVVKMSIDHRSRLDWAFWGVEVFFNMEPIEILFAFEHVTLWRSLLILCVVFVHELKFLILTGLVDINDMLLSLLHHNFSDIFHISILWSLFNLNSYLWVLYKYLIVQKLLGNRYSLHIFLSQINELRFLIEANVIVTNIAILIADDTNLILLFWQSLSHHIKINAHFPSLDEIHICYNIFFV